MDNEVRMGVIGLGGMGAYHACYLRDGKVKGATLTAVSDIDLTRLSDYPCAKPFTDSGDLIRSGEVDAVLIATPHYFHTSIGIDALSNGLHVLTEKPISVHKADCERLIAAHKDTKLVFAAMFNQRANPLYVKLKQMIDRGDLGELVRVTWIVTHWFRTEAYYSSSAWRATWKGEGGGVLINQCPHQLDLLQWLAGMPNNVRAFCKFGSRHDIETEDEVTAYLEYPNGAVGHFITSTGEAPGVNRLEIAGEMGRVVVEDQKLRFIRNEVPATEFSRTSDLGFSAPDTWNIDVCVDVVGPAAHQYVTQDFVDAILKGGEPLVRGEEGVHSVELANAMVYSTLTDSTVELPLDGAAYEQALNQLMANSTHQKRVREGVSKDLAKSFGHHQASA